MISLSKSQAKTINYMHEHQDKLHYAAEISRNIDVPRRSVYSALDELDRKGLVEMEQIGRMKLYRLKEKWIKIVDVAKEKK